MQLGDHSFAHSTVNSDKIGPNALTNSTQLFGAEADCRYFLPIVET
jgi:hypothetical protein